MYLPIITTAVAIESQVCEFDIAFSSISLILLFLCFLREKEKKLCGEALRRLKQYLHEIRHVVLLLRRWPQYDTVWCLSLHTKRLTKLLNKLGT